MLIGRYNKSVILTYIGVAVSVTGMLLAINGRITYAFICLIIAGVCDLFDGMVARMTERDDEAKEFGVQIDSLADMTSFAAFPAVIAISIGLNRWYHLVVVAIFVVCAVIRLAYFNIHRTTNGYYTGLPVTSCAIIFPFFYCFSFMMSKPAFIMMFTAVMFITSVFNVLNIRIKKLCGKWYGIFSMLAAVSAIFLAVNGGRYGR
jgi:CDP-diacylglycerol--serine O-phosphatidyltransferase